MAPFLRFLAIPVYLGLSLHSPFHCLFASSVLCTWLLGISCWQCQRGVGHLPWCFFLHYSFIHVFSGTHCALRYTRLLGNSSPGGLCGGDHLSWHWRRTLIAPGGVNPLGPWVAAHPAVLRSYRGLLVATGPARGEHRPLDPVPSSSRCLEPRREIPRWAGPRPPMGPVSVHSERFSRVVLLSRVTESRSRSSLSPGNLSLETNNIPFYDVAVPSPRGRRARASSSRFQQERGSGAQILVLSLRLHSFPGGPTGEQIPGGTGESMRPSRDWTVGLITEAHMIVLLTFCKNKLNMYIYAKMCT
jgi:hypothetical protein